MKIVSKVALICSIVAAGMFLYKTNVSATDGNQINQTNTNTQNVYCTTGNYGNNYCYNYNTATNSATQSNVLGATTDRNFYHKAVDTGMDPVTATATVVGFITTTGGAIVTLKSKIRVS